jgi:hypothetical protein
MLTLAAMILFLELELRRKLPLEDASYDDHHLLQALETSCTLWKDVKDSSDETGRIHQMLAGMLSSFQTGVGTGLSQTGISELPIELPAFSPPFRTPNDGFLFDDVSNMDIDWVRTSHHQLELC